MLAQADMTMAVKVWSHMREQGVQPLEQEYQLMIQGWAKSGELWDRVRDGSVEQFLQELCDSGFELCPVEGVAPGTVHVVDFTRTTLTVLLQLLALSWRVALRRNSDVAGTILKHRC